MKNYKNIISCAVCCFAALTTISSNIAVADHFYPYPHHHHHHHYHPQPQPQPQHKHHHNKDWAIPAALVVGGIIGAVVAGSSHNSHTSHTSHTSSHSYPPPPPPPVYDTPPDNGFWHYCPTSHKYYPYVQTCSVRWKEVVPN